MPKKYKKIRTIEGISHNYYTFRNDNQKEIEVVVNKKKGTCDAYEVLYTETRKFIFDIIRNVDEIEMRKAIFNTVGGWI